MKFRSPSYNFQQKINKKKQEKEKQELYGHYKKKGMKIILLF